MNLWPCNICDAPGVRNVGTEGKCARHLAELYATFNPVVFKLHGIGLPGATPCENDLTCTSCGATWVGPVGESCYYCARARRIQLDHQAELVLERPDAHPDDSAYEARMTAWAQRMATAVTEGIITTAQAQGVWTRAHAA